MTSCDSKGGQIMTQAVEAYHHVSTSAEFRELERLRDRTRHKQRAVNNRPYGR